MRKCRPVPVDEIKVAFVGEGFERGRDKIRGKKKSILILHKFVKNNFIKSS